jgi:hypothetical protein
MTGHTDTDRRPTLQGADASRRDVLLAGLPACFMAAVCLSFFLARAFTIDDTFFLRAARQAMLTPLHPFAFDMCWEADGKVRRFSQFVANAPLMGYVLIPALRSATPEIAGHLMQIALLNIAVLATASVALRLGLSRREACIAALLTATCPVVLGMASSVMPDILAMTLGVVAFERFLAWRLRKGFWAAAAATTTLALAPLARTHLALMMPACALLCLPKFSSTELRPGWRRAIPGLVPIAISASVYFGLAMITRDPIATAVVLREGLIGFSPIKMLRHGLSLGSYLALTTPFVAGVLLMMVRRASWRIAGALPLAALFWISPSSLWTEAALAGLASAALIWSLARLWKIGSGTSPALGLWAVFPFAMIVYLHMAAKYLVPSVPAYSLILVILARGPVRPGRRVWAGLAGAGLTFGMLIVSADSRAADMARLAIEKWVSPREAGGRTVLFEGQWGFQWYAELHGASCFNPKLPASAHPGDFVVVDLIGSRAFPQILYPHARLLDTISDLRPGGVLIDRKLNVGFYSDGFGSLPWFWAPAGTLRYELWEIE